MGKFYRCVDEDDNKLTTDIVKNRQECDEQGYRWRNAKVNFDNVASGYLALLQIVSYLICILQSHFCLSYKYMYVVCTTSLVNQRLKYTQWQYREKKGSLV